VSACWLSSISCKLRRVQRKFAKPTQFGSARKDWCCEQVASLFAFSCKGKFGSFCFRVRFICFNLQQQCTVQHSLLSFCVKHTLENARAFVAMRPYVRGWGRKKLQLTIQNKTCLAATSTSSSQKFGTRRTPCAKSIVYARNTTQLPPHSLQSPRKYSNMSSTWLMFKLHRSTP